MEAGFCADLVWPVPDVARCLYMCQNQHTYNTQQYIGTLQLRRPIGPVETSHYSEAVSTANQKHTHSNIGPTGRWPYFQGGLSERFHCTLLSMRLQVVAFRNTITQNGCNLHDHQFPPEYAIVTYLKNCFRSVAQSCGKRPSQLKSPSKNFSSNSSRNFYKHTPTVLAWHDLPTG